MITTRSIPNQAIELVKRFEGLSLTKYIDADGWPTIGYGHKLTDNEKYETITQEQATALLRMDIATSAMAVIRLTSVPLTDNQYSALIDFTYNLGTGSYQASTLRRMINRKEYEEASYQFKRWVYGNGRRLPGLVARRNVEEELFNE